MVPSPPQSIERRKPGLALTWLAAYVLALLILMGWVQSPLWLQLPLCGIVLPLIVYLATPVGTALGAWEYLSGYLLLHRPNPRAPLALHLGTSYDILWRLMPARRTGESLFQTLHRELYTGLYRFSQRVESGQIDRATPVIACSYFLTSKQMARYGFREAPTSALKKLSFVAGYPEVLAQQFLITGKLRLFNPLQVRAFTATAGDIADRSDYFARLAARSGSIE